MRMESDDAVMTIPAPVSEAGLLLASTLTIPRLSVFQSGAPRRGKAMQSGNRNRRVIATFQSFGLMNFKRVRMVSIVLPIKATVVRYVANGFWLVKNSARG